MTLGLPQREKLYGELFIDNNPQGSNVIRMKLFILVVLSLFGTQAVCKSNSIKKLPVEEIWTKKEVGADDEYHISRYVQLPARTFDLLFAKIDREKFSPRLWRADINNDKEAEYIFLLTPRNKEDGSADPRLLDKIGPIFKIQDGQLVEIRIPAFSKDYTNILLPFLEYGNQGLQINVHYSARLNRDGSVRAIGNKGVSEVSENLSVSRKLSFIWKDDSLVKIKERLECTTTTSVRPECKIEESLSCIPKAVTSACTKKQINVVNESQLPKVNIK